MADRSNQVDARGKADVPVILAATRGPSKWEDPTQYCGNVEPQTDLDDARLHPHGPMTSTRGLDDAVGGLGSY